jgi:hypothetical protein
VIACVVAPFDHKYPVAEVEVSVTLPPLQNVVLLPGVITGMVGFALTVTVVGAEVDEHPDAFVTVTE